MTTCWRRLAIFFSLLLFTAAVALVIVSLLTEYWLESRPVDAENAINRYNYIHSGLFKGSRQLDWGLGPRYKAFTVYEEVHEGVGFFSRIPWIFTLFFISLGLLWNVIGVVICIINAVMKDNGTIAGPIGIYFWSILACTLSFSFYLMVAAMVVLLIPNVLMFVTEKSIRNPKKDKRLSVDNTAFLY